MGIRGLGAAVQPYGVFSPLSGETVVIDGPALVHQIFKACMTHRPHGSGFVCHPSYSVLGRMVLGWLDELKRHNVNVRKIYFDGYLPPSKWSVRKERLLLQSQNMKALISSHPAGSPRSPENAFVDLKADMTLTRIFGYSFVDKLPKAPFLVPAVLEMLINSPQWGLLTQVVPGEADLYCAQDIKENGGTVLTSDSDLLIQDLGPNGNVCFFGDIVPVDRSNEESGITACRISLHDINDRLCIANVGGLRRVAFEMVRGRLRFNQAQQKAKEVQEEVLESPEFQSFIAEHEMTDYLPREHPLLGVLSMLDPRVSEVVVQSALIGETGAMAGNANSQRERGPDSLSVFIPVMIEDRDKRSAWSMSTAVRQIAYGLLRYIGHGLSTVIIEYRTLDSTTPLTGRQVDIPSRAEITDHCSQLAEMLDKLTVMGSPLNMPWFLFAIYQDMEWSSSEHRPPLSLSLANKVVKGLYGKEDYSWELIHFTAQAQASFYSLRMVKQILDVVLSMTPDLPKPLHLLREKLSSLPLIAEWPRIEEISDLLARVGSSKVLARFADILDITANEPEEHKASSQDHSKTKKRRKDRDGSQGAKRRQQTDGRSPSLNPFAILSQESQP
ncbi:XPG domain containing-domain-containing protein [Xylariomycetidae sp. FL2044]|nr:XPG domain containing-domain-containing protein [Xylariomycetidae sp. FL2044]